MISETCAISAGHCISVLERAEFNTLATEHKKNHAERESQIKSVEKKLQTVAKHLQEEQEKLEIEKTCIETMKKHLAMMREPLQKLFSIDGKIDDLP